MNPILAGIFIGLTSTKFVKLVPIGISTWPPGPILRSDWLTFLKIFLSETTQPMDLLHGVNDPRMVLYQVCVFVADPKSKMAATVEHSLT